MPGSCFSTASHRVHAEHDHRCRVSLVGLFTIRTCRESNFDDVRYSHAPRMSITSDPSLFPRFDSNSREKCELIIDSSESSIALISQLHNGGEDPVVVHLSDDVIIFPEQKR